jgi:hypothetical protein
MHHNLIPFLAVWVVFAAGVIFLIGWRKVVASHEDETLHVMNTGAVSQQEMVAHKLDQIDKWGKILTAITVVYGLALGAYYMYQNWLDMSRLGV